jgi:hypothetical protein
MQPASSSAQKAAVCAVPEPTATPLDEQPLELHHSPLMQSHTADELQASPLAKASQPSGDLFCSLPTCIARLNAHSWADVLTSGFPCTVHWCLPGVIKCCTFCALVTSSAFDCPAGTPSDAFDYSIAKEADPKPAAPASSPSAEVLSPAEGPIQAISLLPVSAPQPAPPGSARVQCTSLIRVSGAAPNACG